MHLALLLSVLSKCSSVALLSSKYNALHPRIFHWTRAYVDAHTESKAAVGFFAKHWGRVLERHDIIWLRTGTSGGHDLKRFQHEVLERKMLKRPFYLLTTDGDSSFPGKLTLCDHPMVVAWYTQNWDGTKFPCVRPFPIGLDMHTWHDVNDMIEIGKTAPSLAQRKQKIIWAGQLDSPGRIRLVHNNMVARLPQMSRKRYWRTIANAAYVASPPGNGLDCHRTWEALYLGCIVIAEDNSLRNLYKGLKVITTRDWSAIKVQDSWRHTPGKTGPPTVELQAWLPEPLAFQRKQGVVAAL